MCTGACLFPCYPTAGFSWKSSRRLPCRTIQVNERGGRRIVPRITSSENVCLEKRIGCSRGGEGGSLLERDLSGRIGQILLGIFYSRSRVLDECKFGYFFFFFRKFLHSNRMKFYHCNGIILKISFRGIFILGWSRDTYSELEIVGDEDLKVDFFLFNWYLLVLKRVVLIRKEFFLMCIVYSERNWKVFWDCNIWDFTIFQFFNICFELNLIKFLLSFKLWQFFQISLKNLQKR